MLAAQLVPPPRLPLGPRARRTRPQPLGGVTFDLIAIALTHDVRAAFGDAPSLTVTQMLAAASSRSNVGGTAWYGGWQPTRTLASDAFLAISTEDSFAP
jgi:hypothetical protein